MLHKVDSFVEYVCKIYSCLSNLGRLVDYIRHCILVISIASNDAFPM